MNTAYNVKRPVKTGICPALDIRGHFGIIPRTVNEFFQTNSLLFQPGHSGNGLKGRARGLFCLGGVIIHRQGQILLQLVEINGVHRSREAVIIIAWIRNQRFYLPCVDVADDHGAGAGVQSQLGRRNLNIGNTVNQKGIGVVWPVGT